MRLINVDKLIDNLDEMILADDGGDYAMGIATAIQEAGRMAVYEEVKAIPLDKPFCKMVYGDYVVYNKKWLVNHLQTEWNILQGKEYKPAIPVEWINKWVITKFVGAGRVIDSMIEDWEKENDKGSE